MKRLQFVWWWRWASFSVKPSYVVSKRRLKFLRYLDTKSDVICWGLYLGFVEIRLWR